MNPPFGEPTVAGLEYIEREFREGTNDIFAAFVLRMSQLVSPRGRIGAITSRSFFVGRDLRTFRRAILEHPSCPLELVLDLGLGVLDAMVETASYVLGDAGKGLVRFRNLRGTPKDEDSMSIALDGAAWVEHERAYFRKLPHCQFHYELSAGEAGALLSDARIEPSIGRVTKGLSTGDDERFVRLRWEIPGAGEDASDGWEAFSKGGEYGWFSGDVHLLLNRRQDGAELAAHAERTHGNVALSRQSSTYYGRAAVTWSRRSQKGFSARRLRSGVCFSDKSPVIVPNGTVEHWVSALLVAFTTEFYLTLIYAQSKFGSYETGSVKTLPAPDADLADAAAVTTLELFRGIDEIDARDELCQLFVAPPRDEWNVEERVRGALGGLRNILRAHGYQCSQPVIEHTLEVAVARIREVSSTGSRLSYSIGVVLGRWTGDVLADIHLPGPLDELSRRSPGESPRAPTLEESVPAHAGPEWLTDDEGARSDITAAVKAYHESVWGAGEGDAERERERAL